MAAVTPGSCPLAPLHTDEVSSSLEITSSTAQENKAATPAVNARTHESAPLRGGDTGQAKIRKIWSDHFDFRRIQNQFRLQWVDRVHVRRTAPTVASCTQQGNSEIQMSGHVQNNAFVFFLLFPTADPESENGKTRHLLLLRTGRGDDYQLAIAKPPTHAQGGQCTWLAVTGRESPGRRPMPGRAALQFAHWA